MVHRSCRCVCECVWMCLYGRYVKETTSKVMKEELTNKQIIFVNWSAARLLLCYCYVSLFFQHAPSSPGDAYYTHTHTIPNALANMFDAISNFSCFFTFFAACLWRWKGRMWKLCVYYEGEVRAKKKKKTNLSLPRHTFLSTFCLMACCMYDVRVCSVHLRCPPLLTESTWDTSSLSRERKKRRTHASQTRSFHSAKRRRRMKMLYRALSS